MNIDYVIYSLYISESKCSHRFPDFLTFHQVEVETTSGALLRSRIRAFRGWLSKVFTPEFLVPF